MYNDKVMNCFFNPKHAGVIENYSARGFTGSIECGDAMEITLKIDEREVITNAKFRAYGCTAAIASSEAIITLILGKTISEAENIRNSDIVNYLNGLPDLKLHCSVLGQDVLKDAICNYRKIDNKSEENEVICKCNNIKRKNIENLIIDKRIFSYRELQKLTNVGTICGKCENRVYAILSMAIEKENEILNLENK
ncbi:MAG: iron-sulfur cluster assembly scaffold protein [Candidatus Cloacimonetes bacterium]|jgi:NifU-like protein|nr:iron-sulfur cluster assembly scaffold protein [Candidatus Cloacimonadota bacterium]